MPQALFDSKRDASTKPGSAQQPLSLDDDDDSSGGGKPAAVSRRQKAKANQKTAPSIADCKQKSGFAVGRAASQQDAAVALEQNTQDVLGSAQQPLSLDDDDDGSSLDAKTAEVARRQIEETNLKPPPANYNDNKKPGKAAGMAVSKLGVAAVAKRQSTQNVLDLLDSDEEDEALLKPVFKLKEPNHCDVVDLTSPRSGQNSDPTNLEIFIDDRERSRNAQPRYLRMQLNQLLASQISMLFDRRYLSRQKLQRNRSRWGILAFRLVEKTRMMARVFPCVLNGNELGILSNAVPLVTIGDSFFVDKRARWSISCFWKEISEPLILL